MWKLDIFPSYFTTIQHTNTGLSCPGAPMSVDDSAGQVSKWTTPMASSSLLCRHARCLPASQSFTPYTNTPRRHSLQTVQQNPAWQPIAFHLKPMANPLLTSALNQNMQNNLLLETFQPLIHSSKYCKHKVGDHNHNNRNQNHNNKNKNKINDMKTCTKCCKSLVLHLQFRLQLGQSFEN